jgi:hypothetical protein
MREHQLDRTSAMVMLLEMPEAEANVLLGPAWCRAVGL